MHRLHPGRRTSRGYRQADLRPECCCRPRQAKTRGNPTGAAVPPCGRARIPCRWRPDRIASWPLTQRMDCSSGNRFHSRKGGLSLSGRRASRQNALVRGLFHPLRNLQAGKGRLAQAHRLARRQICRCCAISLLLRKRLKRDSSVSTRSNAACAACAAYVLSHRSDAHLKVGRHGGWLN